MIEGVLFDLEDTLVMRKSYQIDLDQTIFYMISQVQKCGLAEAQRLFRQARCRFPTTTATVGNLGVSKREFHFHLDQIELTSPVVSAKGVPDILYQLKTKGLKLGIITNMPKRLTQKVLKSADISSDVFDVIVTGSDAHQPKPALDSFLLAIRLIGLPFNRCIMIGDREEVDLDPAKQLGMKTVLIGKVALRADYTLTSLAELEYLILTTI